MNLLYQKSAVTLVAIFAVVAATPLASAETSAPTPPPCKGEDLPPLGGCVYVEMNSATRDCGWVDVSHEHWGCGVLWTLDMQISGVGICGTSWWTITDDVLFACAGEHVLPTHLEQERLYYFSAEEQAARMKVVSGERGIACAGTAVSGEGAECRPWEHPQMILPGPPPCGDDAAYSATFSTDGIGLDVRALDKGVERDVSLPPLMAMPTELGVAESPGTESVSSAGSTSFAFYGNAPNC